MRGDMVPDKEVKCTYASAKQEKYSFSLGDMYIDKVYVSEGRQAEKDTLLAELKKGDFARAGRSRRADRKPRAGGRSGERAGRRERKELLGTKKGRKKKLSPERVKSCGNIWIDNAR